MDIDGDTQVYMKYMGIYGYIQHMTIYGYRRVYICGYIWVYMEIYGI